MTSSFNSADWQLGRTLDRAKVGDTINIPSYRSGQPARAVGYLFNPILDRDLEQSAYEQTQNNNPRKKNVYRGSAKTGGEPIQEAWEDIHYKGAYKSYTGSQVLANYQSAIAVTRSGRSAVVVKSCKLVRRLLAPVGLRFEIDKNGVLLKRISDGMDFHPAPADWKRKDFTTYVRSRMASNYHARLAANRSVRETERHQKIYNREIGSVRVTLNDSRRAGNCVEGSLKYAESRLGLTRSEILAGDYLFSVPASRLLEPGCGNLARAAVQMAWMRETAVQI